MGGLSRLAGLVVLLLAGCAATSPFSCRQTTGNRDPAFEGEHRSRVAATEQSPAESRSPDDKGPSPEGVEAIALLGGEFLDAKRETCQQHEASETNPQGASR